MNAVSELNLKLLRRAPFLATVALHAEVLVQEHPGVEVAATDGRRIFLSPSHFMTRPVAERLFIYAHEVLHCALSHPKRRGSRHPERWNFAADIVVNGVLLESGFELPGDAVRADDLAHLGTEEVYDQLTQNPKLRFRGSVDLLDGGGGDAETRGYWQGVLCRAATLARMTRAGTLPLGKELDVALGVQTLDWREALLRHLVVTQDDYGGFDTRLIHAGLYVETLESRGVTVAVHIDTSGSLNNVEAQGQFLAELNGILSAYPNVQISLTYGDIDLHGPYELTRDTAVPTPKGGGGTDFVPFFERAEDLEPGTPLVVFTDGYGGFPDRCDHPCLWVVNEGGLPSDRFPFGEVIRLAR